MQRRGPQPRSASQTIETNGDFTPPTQRAPMARFDVRAELTEGHKEIAPTKSQPQRITTEAKKEKSAEVKRVKVTTEKIDPPSTERIEPPSTSKPIVESETVARVVEPPTDSRACKEAMSERELATQAPENSDKLFHLRRALRLCPSSAPLHFELGKIYASMERTSNAEEEFKQALSLDPSMTAAKTSLSDLLKNETRF